MKFNSQRRTILPLKKMTIRQSTWNCRSFLVRLIFAFTVFCAFFWVLIQLHSLFYSGTSEFVPSRDVNFTITFSNLQREYSMEKPLNNPCSGRSVKMLVLIMSRRETSQKRKGIRESWAQDSPDDIIVRFVIGSATPDEKNQTFVDSQLDEEQWQFDDLIRYGIQDGYNNLHFKMSAAFQWQQAFCPEADFVMKTDDDTIVDLPRWKFWAERKFEKDLATNRKAFFGYLLENTAPIRDKGHKWYVSVDHFPGDRFPDYMQGATYFGTGEAIRAVMAHTHEVIGYNMDDIIFTGTLADRANVSRFDYKAKHFRGGAGLLADEPCEMNTPLVFTMFSAFTKPDEYIQAYKRLHSLKCEQRAAISANSTR